MSQHLEKPSVTTVANGDMDNLRWSTKQQRSIVKVHVLAQDDETLYCRAPKSAYQSPLRGCDQKDVRLRGDAISAKHTGAAEDSRRQEISLAQQNLAMGRVSRRILKRRIDVGLSKVREVLQDLLRRHAAGKHFKHMANRDSHPANRRFTTAHIWFDRDTIDMHGPIL
jgi:hypothetical protein